MSVNSHALHPIQNVKEGVMRDLLWGLKDTKIDATIPFKGAFITCVKQSPKNFPKHKQRLL